MNGVDEKLPLEFPYRVWDIFGAFANLKDICT